MMALVITVSDFIEYLKYFPTAMQIISILYSLLQNNIIWWLLNPNLKQKFRAWNLLAHNLLLSCQIVLTFCTEHDSDTAKLWAKSQIFIN